MYINEKLQIEEYNYPFADKVNPLLESEIKKAWDVRGHRPSNIHAHFTGFDFERNNKLAQNLSCWVNDLIRRDFIQGAVDLKCVELWGVLYKEGDYITEHNHSPSLYSFSYYVNAPKGSSPLVFVTSGRKIKPEAGKVVIFESRLKHKVLPNKVNGRCIISGNFIYDKGEGTYNKES